MIAWAVLVLLLLPGLDAIGHPRYECGENGRFEYCIDGIPGCVVGCHCHPGFYFDTETKICEPNAILVQQSRRLYDPTRVPVHPAVVTHNLVAPTEAPTSTTTSPIDSHVEAVAKDTDDLGDWLYNQFFKTIENQIINNTDAESAKPKPNKVPTRRIGNAKKKTSKKSKIKSILKSKKNKKKNDLRRKLLRITEDDSLFDSGSDSDNSKSSSGSSDGSSCSEVSKETNGGTSIDTNDDKEHRKFVWINKKPKPPLPSFIFLPNFDTPFYPPIGLPPAPVIPMYPMVPVPPMSFWPVNPENTTTSKPGVTINNKTPPASVVTSDPPPSDVITTTTITTTTTTTTTEASDDKFQRARLRNAQRKNLLQQIRNTMKIEPDGKISPPHRFRVSQPTRNSEIEEIPEPLGIDPQDMPNFRAKTESPDDLAHGGHVDFKYLAQLIHKMGTKISNKSVHFKNATELPKRRSNLEDPYYSVGSYESQPTRRAQDQRFPQKTNDDELYYAHLGHEIANLIRKIDTPGNSDREKETENNRLPIAQPVFTGNHYTQRSYWERSVRSPLMYHSYALDLPTMTYQNLINLEKKVEIVASTVRPLSLRELENAISYMDKAKAQIRESVKIKDNIPMTKGNLNINLLPRPSELPLNTRRNIDVKSNKLKNLNEAELQSGITQPSNQEVIQREKINRPINLTTQINEFKANVNKLSRKLRIAYSNIHNTKNNVDDIPNDKVLLDRKANLKITGIDHNYIGIPSQFNYRRPPQTLPLKQGQVAVNQKIYYHSNLLSKKVSKFPLLDTKPQNYQHFNHFFRNSDQYIVRNRVAMLPHIGPINIDGASITAGQSYFHHELPLDFL